MPRQPLEQCAIRSVPHIHVAIIAPADQPRPGRTPGHATDPGREPIAHPARGVHHPIPHQHTLQNSSAGQALPVRTPGHAEEDGFGVVKGPQDLHAGPGSWLPEPDGMIPPGTGEQSSIRAPRDAGHAPAMAAQHASRPPTGHLPDDDLHIRTGTGELCGIRTPV